MQVRRRTGFISVRTEGVILPPDILQRIQGGDRTIGGLDLPDFHLKTGERLNEVISRSWNRLQAAWANFQAAASRLPEEDLGTALTRERFLLPLFQELRYGRLATTSAINLDSRTYAVSHAWGRVPIHLVGFRVELDRRTPGVAGAARASPHSMVQELLNRSDDHLWALLSNGLILRILRDNVSLVRQAYVEFDLEAMFEGEAYADFTLLWLLCHQSRVEGDKPGEFWLERWSKLAQEQGTRALESLREGVEQAIRALGQGFLSHRANESLRRRLASEDLTPLDYYRQLLRLVYRLIFLFVAEDRELLFHPDAAHAAKERYRRFYSATRLRRLAERLRGGRHGDLFESLKLVMRRLNEDGGCPELGLPEVGSFLWSAAAIPDLEGCLLANQDLLAAVRSLAFTEESGVRRIVDYRNLGPEELGSVYEALLELEPRLNTDAGSFELEAVVGGERKTTGSYYTPTSLIRELLNSALEPVLDEAVRSQDPQAALLDLKVCDPACGSGHFLIAAAHRIAQSLAEVRTGDPQAGPGALRTALREVISCCIYGVDVNPMAVELCKVNLWLESLDPGRPLSFLDHRIRVGNSLLGATPALIEAGIPNEACNPIEGDDRDFASSLKGQNRKERTGQMSMFERMAAERRATYSTLAASMDELRAVEADSLQGLRQKEAQYRRIMESDEYRRTRLVGDAWCAAFFWRKHPDAPPALTEALFRRVAVAPDEVPEAVLEEIERLRHQYALFHWHLAFPDVFSQPKEGDQAENPQTGWSGGFHVVLANPPWERVKLQEKEWFAGRDDEIATAPNKGARARLISKLQTEDPALYAAFLAAKRAAEGESQFLRNSDRFPLCGRGDINTYPVFAELMRSLIGPGGRVGCIVPTGIATDDTTKVFFQDLMDRGALAGLYDFENRRALFPASHRSYKFCLLTLTGPARPVRAADFAFFALGTEDLREEDRHFSLSREEIALINPNTRTCPIFRSKKDAELTKAIYRRVPVLIREGLPEENAWESRLSTIFHSSGAADHFVMASEAHQDARGSALLPLYEARLFHQYDHRYASYGPSGDSPQETSPAMHGDPEYEVAPRIYMDRLMIQSELQQLGGQPWLLGFRKICRSTDERTSIFAVLPPVGALDSVHIMSSPRPKACCCLLVNGNSFCLDFVLRQLLGGANFNFFIAKQLPFVSPPSYRSPCMWDSRGSLEDWILKRAIELSYTSSSLAEFATLHGCASRPFRWNESRRLAIRAELDAAFFHLYLWVTPDGGWRPARVAEGAVRDETDDELAELQMHFPTPRLAVDYILDTFTIVRRKDEEQYGEYRTKRIILEIYDDMQRAIATGEPYRTHLDPPPAALSVTHGHSGVH